MTPEEEKAALLEWMIEHGHITREEAATALVCRTEEERS